VSERRSQRDDMQALPTQGQGSPPTGQWYSGATPLVRTYCRSSEVHPYLWFGTCGPLAERTGAGNLRASIGTSGGGGEDAGVAPGTPGNTVRQLFEAL
jgi:hypothetical protein